MDSGFLPKAPGEILKGQGDRYCRGGPLIYTITTAADMLDVSAVTLKIWEGTGVIPKAERDCNGRRVYSDDDMVKLKQIAAERKEARGRSREL